MCAANERRVLTRQHSSKVFAKMRQSNVVFWVSYVHGFELKKLWDFSAGSEGAHATQVEQRK